MSKKLMESYHNRTFHLNKYSRVMCITLTNFYPENYQLIILATLK